MHTPQDMITAWEKIELLNAQWGDALRKNQVSTSCRLMGEYYAALRQWEADALEIFKATGQKAGSE